MTKFKLKRLKPRDVGKQIARVDPEYMQKNNLKGGEFVKIYHPGEDNTEVVKVIPGYNKDYGKRTIRVQSYVRKSLKARVDDAVEVGKINKQDISIAEKVVLSTDKNIRIKNLEVFKTKMRNKLKKSPFLENSLVIFPLFGMSKIPFVIDEIQGDSEKGVYIADDSTEVDIKMKSGKQQTRSTNYNQSKESPFDQEQTAQTTSWESNIKSEVTYEDIGGLNKEMSKIREMIELPLRHPQIFDTLGIDSPKGLLLHGPPGTGKTLLAKAVANEVDASFFNISGPEILSKFYGESEEQLREVFEEASKKSPSIIFIDEIDSIAPNRNEASGDVEKRIVAELLSRLDGLESRGEVVVIGATNRVNQIDPALRRGGRFDREIEIGVPDKQGRKEILQIHTRGMPLEDDVDLDKIAAKTHGYVGADLATLAKEAAMNVLDDLKEEIDFDKDEISSDLYNDITISKEDFQIAMREVEPSAMRELFVETPDITYEDVGGLQDTKQKLIESIEWPIDNPEIFEESGIEPPKGTILFGPPGTGKTLLAKAVANESESNFISVKGPEILNKYVGESEKGIRDIFKKARQNAPAVIFFDEIDAIATERGSSSGEQVTERVVSQLLTELDGIEKLSEVKVIATTNRPDLLDSALLRPGRFDNLIRVEIPDKQARKEIFKIHTRNTPTQKIDIDSLVDKTKGYTGSDIENICKKATMKAIRRVYNKDKKVQVTMKDFTEALEETSSSVKGEQIEKYKQIEEKLQESGHPQQNIDNNNNAFI